MVQDPMSSSVDFEDIARRGELLYTSRLKNQYEPHQNGRFLAIEVNSQDVFLGETSQEAVDQAKLAHPDKVFFLVKIGYHSLESIARFILEKRKTL